MKAVELVLVSIVGGVVAGAKVWLYSRARGRRSRQDGRPARVLAKSLWVAGVFSVFLFVLLLVAER